MTHTAIAIAGAVRLAISTGLTIARPAHTIAAPAIGDDERPSAPEIAAAIPSLSCAKPRSEACTVIAWLNAIVAASPEPVTVPMRYGTKVPP